MNLQNEGRTSAPPLKTESAPRDGGSLALARCLHHPAREAVCRCPMCTRYFCRECITEHEGQFLCSRCVAETQHAKATGRGMGAALLTSAMTIGGFLLMTGIFYLLGVMVAINFNRWRA